MAGVPLLDLVKFGKSHLLGSLLLLEELLLKFQVGPIWLTLLHKDFLSLGLGLLDSLDSELLGLGHLILEGHLVEHLGFLVLEFLGLLHHDDFLLDERFFVLLEVGFTTWDLGQVKLLLLLDALEFLLSLGLSSRELLGESLLKDSLVLSLGVVLLESFLEVIWQFEFIEADSEGFSFLWVLSLDSLHFYFFLFIIN